MSHKRMMLRYASVDIFNDFMQYDACDRQHERMERTLHSREKFKRNTHIRTLLHIYCKWHLKHNQRLPSSYPLSMLDNTNPHVTYPLSCDKGHIEVLLMTTLPTDIMYMSFTARIQWKEHNMKR
eukprot:970926_1